MANPNGSRLFGPFSSVSTLPSRRMPSALEESIVNQTAPSGATAIAVGMPPAGGSGYSTKPGDAHGPKRQAATPTAAITTRATAGSQKRGRRGQWSARGDAMVDALIAYAASSS